MNRFGVIGTTALFLLAGFAAPAGARQQDQGKPQKQEQKSKAPKQKQQQSKPQGRQQLAGRQAKPATPTAGRLAEAARNQLAVSTPLLAAARRL